MPECYDNPGAFHNVVEQGACANNTTKPVRTSASQTKMEEHSLQLLHQLEEMKARNGFRWYLHSTSKSCHFNYEYLMLLSIHLSAQTNK